MSTGIASKKDSEKESRSDTRRSFRYTCASILIALTMICSAVAVIGFSDSSDAAVLSTGVDKEIRWTITDDHTLTISNDSDDGEMGDFGQGGPEGPRPPWENGDGWGQVTKLVIQNNVKNIGTYAFWRCNGLTSVEIDDDLDFIDNSAFVDCSNLPTITIPDNVRLRSEIFCGCDSLASIVFKGVINVDGSSYYTFDHTPSLHVVYYTGSGLDLEKWPDQDIVFINTNGGTVTGSNTALPDGCKFPGSSVYTPPSGAFVAYEVNGIYYGAGDYVPEGKVTASIKWDPFDPIYKAPVLFFNNGHGTAPNYQLVNCGDPAVRPSPDPTAEGYTFDGWYLSPDGTKPWDFDTKVFRAIILYAKWTGNVIVTFDVNGHGTAPNPIEVETGNPIGKPEDPTAEGYKFNGWYKERTCQTKWNFDDPVTDKMTLYAEWDVQSCRVSFDMMGHGLGPDPQMVNYGDQVAEPAAISIEGYTFGGWFKDISFENQWNFDNDFVKSDTVLYAKWVSNSSGGNNGATVPVWALTSVIAGSVVFVGAAILLLRRH